MGSARRPRPRASCLRSAAASSGSSTSTSGRSRSTRSRPRSSRARATSRSTSAVSSSGISLGACPSPGPARTTTRQRRTSGGSSRRSGLGLTALWLVFGGMPIGLATCRVRDGLVSRLGERGFLALFSLIAAVSFSVLVHYYTLHRFDGPPGLALGAVPALRWTLMAVVVVGVGLIAASLVVYPRSPLALFHKTGGAPPGLERATRPA